MKRARNIIILIISIFCANISLAQEKTELQQVIDSVEQIKYISESDNDGWGGVPISWKLQERLKALATEDDLARLALESKSPQARAFAYTVLVKRKSDKCFDLFKKMLMDDSEVGYRSCDVFTSSYVNNYITYETNKAGIFDSTQIANLDSLVIFTPNFPECKYLYEALERAVPQPEYYDRICQIFNEGHWSALEYIATYKKDKDIKLILETLNEYKIKTYNDEWNYYELVLEDSGEEEAKKFKPKHPRKTEHSAYALDAIERWPHPAFITTLEKYIESKELADKKHYHGSTKMMNIMMNFDNDWAYQTIERYLKHPMGKYYSEYFSTVYKSHKNKERFTPLHKKYCKQSKHVLVDSIYYVLDRANKEASVSNDDRDYDSPYSGDIVIPSTITYNDTTYTVTSIGDKAFHIAKKLHSISMPNTITSIGKDAFGGCRFQSVTIPNSVTCIGEYAFSYCNELKSIKLSDSLTTIVDRAFVHCDSLSTITFPNTLIYIGNRAFAECHSLTSIIIPRSVTSIVSGAFMFSPITSIVVDKDNTVYDSRNNCNAIIETKTNKLIVGCATTIIPDNITSIGEQAFQGCDSIRTIVIPESVTEICRSAFFQCSNMISIYIPQTVKSIGRSAFSECSKLKSITIPQGIRTIEDFTFDGCESLTSIIIPTSVTNIGDNAFVKCNKLTSITIPDSVTSIGQYSFSGCESLKSIRIPNSVVSIGAFAFTRCKNITSVHIGKSLTTFEKNIFTKSDNIDSVSVDKDNPNFDSRNDCNAIINKKTNELALGFNTTIIPNSVTGIEDYAFRFLNGLKNIVIPESVQQIGKEAFRACSSLTSVTLPSSLKIIGRNAFEDCIELKDVTTFSMIPQPINDYAFPIRITEYEDLFHGKNVKNEMFLHVPKGCKKKYSKAKFWKEFTITEDAEMINEK